jgi:hypothetical protein
MSGLRPILPIRPYEFCRTPCPTLRSALRNRMSKMTALSLGFSSTEIDTWSTQFRYISLFACENSHYLCTGTRARPKETRKRLRCPNARSGGRSRHSELGMRARDTTARVVCNREDDPGGEAC